MESKGNSLETDLVESKSGSPHQCVYFWARGVAKEIYLQGCGWKWVKPQDVHVDTYEPFLVLDGAWGGKRKELGQELPLIVLLPQTLRI